MNPNQTNHTGTKRVVDDEGTVDQKAKNYIIEAKKRAYQREDDVYIQSPLEGVQLTRQEQNAIWAIAVRQYIRTVEPLLRSDEIPESDYFYNQYEIVNQEILPPDGEYDGHVYRWSEYQHMNPLEIANSHPKITHSFEPPEAKIFTIQGLKDVVETEAVTMRWQVTINPDDPPGAHEVIFPERNIVLRRQWLQEAVRATDQFLQEAGIGVDVGHPEVDDQDLDPF